MKNEKIQIKSKKCLVRFNRVSAYTKFKIWLKEIHPKKSSMFTSVKLMNVQSLLRVLVECHLLSFTTLNKHRNLFIWFYFVFILSVCVISINHERKTEWAEIYKHIIKMLAVQILNDMYLISQARFVRFLFVL